LASPTSDNRALSNSADHGYLGRIALPLGAWTKAVGAGGTIGTDSAMHHDLVALGFRDFRKSAKLAPISICCRGMPASRARFSDQRVHGTTGEVPIERFRRAEAGALRSIARIPPFERARELVRKVQTDCVVEVDSNAYSVPWRLIGESVRVVITGDQLRISHAGREVALHHRQTSRLAILNRIYGDVGKPGARRHW